MATGKNVLSTLHENIWLWQWMKGIAEMSCCHNCTLHIRTFAHLEEMTNKVSTRCQQGVNKVSTRCKICNQRPREKCEVILSVFCLSSENNLRICVCICNLFLEGGTRSKKKIDILEKWKNGKWKMEKWKIEKWKNGGGGNKMGVLIIGQSLRPTDTLRECNIIKLIDY